MGYVVTWSEVHAGTRDKKTVHEVGLRDHAEHRGWSEGQTVKCMNPPLLKARLQQGGTSSRHHNLEHAPRLRWKPDES